MCCIQYSAKPDDQQYCVVVLLTVLLFNVINCDVLLQYCDIVDIIVIRDDIQPVFNMMATDTVLKMCGVLSAAKLTVWRIGPLQLTFGNS